MSRAPPYFPTLEEREIAAAICPSGGAVAFLRYEGELLYATRCPGEGPPLSAVLRLILGVWAARPALAHAVLRSRIFSAGHKSPADRAAVQLGARKLAWIPEVGGAVSPGLSALDLTAAAERLAGEAAARSAVEGLPSDLRGVSEPEITALVAAQARALPRPEGPRWSLDRPVVAALLSPEGRVVAAARNSSGTARVLHAELNLLLRLWREGISPIPPGSKLFVSLQCCRMCAALWAEPEIEVLYAEADPGRLAQHTALSGRERCGMDSEFSPAASYGEIEERAIRTLGSAHSV